jgi:hypothetical protein
MRRQYGFSIIGLLVGLVVGMIAIAAILTTVFNYESSSRQITQGSDQIQTNQRRLVQFIFQQIGNNTGLGLASNYIAGTHNTGPNGSDTLTFSFYNAGGMTDCAGNIAPVGDVNNVLAIDNNNNLICNGAILINNIENMQVLYGEDTSTPADGIADRYVPANDDPDMDHVVSLKLSFLLDGDLNTRNTNSAQSFDLLGTTVNTSDTRMRQVYTTTIKLRNVSS